MSCAIPSIIGVVYYNKFSKSIKKFIHICLLAFVVEATVKVFIELKCRSEIVYTYNFYILINLLLYSLFFRINNILSKRNTYIFCSFFILLWLAHFALYKWQKVYMTSQALTGIGFCLLAVMFINKEFFNTSVKSIANPMILICFGILLQYLFFGLEVFMMFLTNLSADTRALIYRLYEVVNSISYLLFAYGIVLSKNRIST